MDRWNALSPEQREKFFPFAPDFVIELMPPSDRLIDIQEKKQEYIDNGIQLGWLFNCESQQVELYFSRRPKEVLQHPNYLSGGTTLPGFVLNLDQFW